MKRLVRAGIWLMAAILLSTLAAGAEPDQQPPDGIEAIAQDAYVFAFPMLENYRTLYRSVAGQSGVDPGRFNRFTHTTALAGSESRLVVRPNNDTLSSLAWLDLRAEPMVVSLPAIPRSRYWSLQLIDLYTHNLAIISPRTASKVGDTRHYLVAGPHWNAAVPSGMTQVFKSETNFVLALIRTAVSGPEDVVNVRKLQQAYAVTPLHEFVHGQAPSSSARLAFPPFDQQQARTSVFVRYVNFLLGQLQIHPSEASLISRFTRIGIGPNHPFDPATLDDRTRDGIDKGIAAAVRQIAGAGRQLGQERGAWATASEGFGNRERMQGRYLVRAAAAMFGLYGLDAEEAIYMSTGSDADGKRLNGTEQQYTLRFSRQQIPPAAAFWSVTMYDGDGFMVANSKHRYSIGDRTQGLTLGDDGSLTIYLQENPPGPQAEPNWLPAPHGPFSLTLRLYLPKSAAVNSYVPPGVEAVQ